MMLEIRELHVSYGTTAVLHGVDLTVDAGQMVALIGANGAGKTTTLRSISGLVRPRLGRVLYEGQRIDLWPAHAIVNAGLCQIAEGRALFGEMTVLENLLLGATPARARAGAADTLEWVFGLFPVLRERRRQTARTLSGGEQQMLAIGRGLMSQPKLLLLDEPSLGLAPALVDAVAAALQKLRAAGLTILLVEQDAYLALELADYAYVLENGRIALEGPSSRLLENPAVQEAYLGLAGDEGQVS